MTLITQLKKYQKEAAKKVSGLNSGFIAKNRKKILIVSFIIALAALGYIAKGLFVAALVDGYPVTRLSVVRELEKQGGSQILDNLVTKRIILSEASSKGITVSEDDINKELKTIEDAVSAQGMTLDQALSMQNQKKEDLVEQIRIQKIVEKILGDKLSVTDKEIEEYFAANKDVYGAGAKLEDVKEEIRKDLIQSKLSSEYQTWIAGLKEKAKVLYFVNF